MKSRNTAILAFIWIISLLAPVRVDAIETAAQIISKCADKVNTAPSLNASFTLTVGERKSTCDMVISRAKFRLTSPEMTVWYDGTTQWTYISSSKELDITEPTADELLECNPFAILTHYRKAYTARRLGGKDIQIELSASDRSATIRKAIVTVNPTTYLPSKLVVVLSSGKTFVVNVSSATIGKNVPASTFVYDKVKYPAEEIVDLR